METARPFPALILRPTRSAVVTAALLIAVALTGRAVYCIAPVNSDTAMFVYAGKLVAAGGRPGVDLIDNKLPSVGLLMSVPFRCFGAHWSDYGMLGFVMSVIASLLLALAVRRSLGAMAGLVVAVASCVWLNFTPAVYGQLQLETITTFFASIAAACAITMFRRYDWRDALTLGLCVGMGMWAKPTALAIVPATFVTILFATNWRWRQRLGAIFWIGLGLALPLVVCAWLIVINGMADALPATLSQLHDYATASTYDAMDAAKPVMVLAILFFPLLILGFVFRRDRTESCVTRPIRVFAVLWLAAELIGVISQRRMYAYHFIVLGPPAALCMAVVARKLKPMSLLLAFGPPVAIAATWAFSIAAQSPVPSRDDRLIAYLRTSTAPGAAVWMDDYPRLLVEDDFKPGSRVPLIFLFANSDAAPATFGSTIVNDFRQRRPQRIVLPDDVDAVADLYRHHMAEAARYPARAQAIADQLHAIDRYVRSNYTQETKIDGCDVWRRNDARQIEARLSNEAGE